ncbi:MAG: signal peptidase II [Planctomycetaceae bacterium]
MADTPTGTSAPLAVAESAAAANDDAPAAIATCAQGCTLRRVVWLATLSLVIVAVDQASKVYAMNYLQPTASQPLFYLGGILRIQYAENPGAFLSLMGDWSPAARFWVLTVVNGAILGGLAVYLALFPAHSRWQWTALALILAGGVGNLIDRMRFDGRVIDFFLLSSGPIPIPYFGNVQTGIFNVADIAITAGFIMLLPMLLLPERSAPASTARQVAKGV